MPNSLSPNFFIKVFNVHNVEGASCVNIGNNHPTGFTNFKKHNQGFGSVSGSNNTIDGIKTLLNDKSLFDMFQDSDQEDLAWAKKVKDMVMTRVINYLENDQIDEMLEDRGNSDIIDIDSLELMEDDDESYDDYYEYDVDEDEDDNFDEEEEEEDYNDGKEDDLDADSITKELNNLNNLTSRMMKELFPNANFGDMNAQTNPFQPGETNAQMNQTPNMNNNMNGSSENL